jgi:uncharacterized protein YlaN (UPF0358 family)
METEEYLEENRPPQNLLEKFDPTLMKSKRGKDIRHVAGFLMRISKDDADKLAKLIKERLPNATLFYIKLYEPEESVYLVSKTELEDARVEAHRVEIEERNLK